MKPTIGHQFRTPVILMLIVICGINFAKAEPVTTIRNNGDPANRVDFVVLGDGYTAAELGKYATDAETAVNGFFAQEPLRTYRNYFNAHRVDVISNESGADHSEESPPVYKDTAFDARYNCYGIERLICVNTSKVNTVLNRSLNPDQRDIILVLVNDSEYGGSGGYLAVASTHSAVVELVLHEVGHSFGLLADEYSYGSCNNAYEPSEVNVTRETSRSFIKWNAGGGPPTGWIDYATPVPTSGTARGVPGLYEGAKYCPRGLYRPTYNSKMRSLGVPFEQINEEQLIKRIYNWVSPLDASDPSESNLSLPYGQTQDFEIEVPRPLTHDLQASWYLNGEFKHTGLQFSINSDKLALATYTVEAEVRDPTFQVRYDPTGILVETRSWKVQIVLPGDFKSDGDVDGLDLDKFRDAYAAGNETADINGDREVNEKDVSAFAEHFGSSPVEGIK